MAPHPLHHLLRSEHHLLAHLPGCILPALRNVSRALGCLAAEPQAATIPWHGSDWAGNNHKHDCTALCAGLGTGDGGVGLGSVVD